jgi:hypothetical protein
MPGIGTQRKLHASDAVSRSPAVLHGMPCGLSYDMLEVSLAGSPRLAQFTSRRSS